MGRIRTDVVLALLVQTILLTVSMSLFSVIAASFAAAELTSARWQRMLPKSEWGKLLVPSTIFSCTLIFASMAIALLVQSDFFGFTMGLGIAFFVSYALSAFVNKNWDSSLFNKNGSSE